MNLGPIKDKSTRERRSLTRLIGKQGLYAIVFVCIAVIGIVAALSLTSPDENTNLVATQKPNATNGLSAQLTLPPNPTVKPVGGNAEVVDTSLELHNPVNNTKISNGYAMEILVFSDTLKEWTTHAGIDIPADEGAEVFCVLDGTLESAKSDAIMGNTVVISHEDGIKSVYSGLKSIENIQVGAIVLKGQVIGKVGNTAINELEEGNHLHFAMLKGADHINPENYLDNYSK